MSTSLSTLATIPKLKGRDNYATWCFAVKAYLEHEDLWSIVVSPVDGAADPNKISHDTKAKSKLILMIDPQLYVHVQEAKNAHEVWRNLSKAFDDSGLSRRVGLLKELINTHLDSCSDIEDYVNKIMTCAHKLRNIGFMVDDEWLATLMLAGLPDMYKPMVMGLESSGVKISADLIKTKLLQEVPKSDTTAFYTNSRTNPKGQQPSKSKGPRCFTCNKYGHLSRNCWHKKKSVSPSQTVNDNVFAAAFSASQLNDSMKWYIDSGASMHMTRHREWLQNETSPPIQNIRIADNKILQVESCGNVEIRVPASNGTVDKIQVRNVLYVPELKTNLLSVSNIIMSGCKIEFGTNGCQIYNKFGNSVARAKQINGMYRLNTIICQDSSATAMVAETDEDTYMWHQRMGHLNFTDLSKIPNCADGVKLSPKKDNTVCITCLEGKQTRKPFPHDGSRASSLLELIHSDVCGPMQNVSVGGSRYFVTFIDDYSRKVYVYFMENKAEVLEKFKEYKNRVENELNAKIKCLRSDNGTEYINRAFDIYLKSSGILHQTSNPYTPEQNGLSERMNRTLIERAKCMLFNAGLQNNFWAEAVATAAYIVNRSPTRSLADTTPEEQWTGRKPNISNMKIFGCKAMVHIPKEKRRKLDVKSRECIFVGYSDSTKGYRFIDPQSNNVIMSRDVVFLEVTIKKNIAASSEPEKEKCEIRKESSKSSEKKTRINEQCEDDQENIVYLPVCEEESKKTNCEIVEPNPEQHQNTIAHDSSTSSVLAIDENSTYSPEESSEYEDPNDETYMPSESEQSSFYSPPNVRTRRRQEIHENENSGNSFICMNAELTTSLLDSDPQSHEEALQSDNADKWSEAMKSEYNSLLQNNTWTLVDLPKNKKAIPCKWVFKTKRDESGNIERFKARLVIKGYKQTRGVDYHEVFAPVVRGSSMRYLMGIAVKYDLQIHQMDAVSAFLQGDVDAEIYMKQPPGYEEDVKVCRLNKSIYGLKQASRQWNKKLDTALREIGLLVSNVDPCIYYQILNNDDMLFITVYVDDLLYFFNNEKTANIIKKKLHERFRMKDLGESKHCVGYRITRDKNSISLDQAIYIEKILQRFGMTDCKPVATPCDANVKLQKAKNETEILKNIPYQELIGCLLYLSQGTRPDIAYIVNALSRFNNAPIASHWIAAKRVLRYLRGTINTKLTFRSDSKNITGYCDADWANDCEDRRSCTGYIFVFQGAAISWSSKRQLTIALSSTEAEYMSLASATQEALWLKQLEEDFWPVLSGKPILMYCDNQSAISLSDNDVYHARSKHIDVRYHFVREKIANNQILVKFKRTDDMVADAMTKGLHRPKHETFSHSMGLRPGEDDEM